MTSTEPTLGQLHPLNGCVLVELKQSTKNFNVKEGKYDSRTEGIVVATPEKEIAKLAGVPVLDRSIDFFLNKRVHFEEFKEGARIKRGGKVYSFIKIEDIRGYED